MSKFSCNPAAVLRDHLSLQPLAAYAYHYLWLRMQDTGAPVDDDAKRLAIVTKTFDLWPAIRQELIDRKLIYERTGKLHNPKTDEQISERAALAEARRRAAKTRWNGRSKQRGKAPAMQLHASASSTCKNNDLVGVSAATADAIAMQTNASAFTPCPVNGLAGAAVDSRARGTKTPSYLVSNKGKESESQTTLSIPPCTNESAPPPRARDEKSTALDAPPRRSGAERPSAFSQDAIDIADAFLRLRLEFWPTDSRTIPVLPLQTDAQRFVAAGGYPALVIEQLRVAMIQHIEEGEREPPRSLRFCRYSINRAIKAHREQVDEGLATPRGKPRNGGSDQIAKTKSY